MSLLLGRRSPEHLGKITAHCTNAKSLLPDDERCSKMSLLKPRLIARKNYLLSKTFCFKKPPQSLLVNKNLDQLTIFTSI